MLSLHTVARSSSSEATSHNSIRTFNNNQTTITLNPPIIMFEVSKQKVLSCAVDTAICTAYSAIQPKFGALRLSSRARVDFSRRSLTSTASTCSSSPDTRRKTTYASQSQSLPALTASLLHTSFPHYLSSFSVLGQHLPTQSRQPLACGSRTRTFLSHIYFSFVRLPFLYSIPFTGAPEDASTIRNIDIADR
jgi:hypothetical protein